MRWNVKLLFLVTYITLLYMVPSHLALAKISSAKRSEPNQNACLSLVEADSAYRAGDYEKAIKACKDVLNVSNEASFRIKAYRFLITSVRSSQGYDAAIARAEQVYAYICKTRPSKRSETKSIRSILAEMKERKAEYELTISEQEKIVHARPGSDMAAKAALKIAVCKQALGTKKDASKAYGKVVSDYPLTRSGWKASQELAWLRQSEKCNNPNAGLESTIKTIMDKSGRDEASKQAWQLACGTTDFSPSYSDVLRLEAIVADMGMKTTAKAENQPIKEQEKLNNTNNSQSANSPQATTKSSPKQSQRSRSVLAYQSAGLDQLTPAVAWPGPGIDDINGQVQKKTSSKKSSKTKSASSQQSVDKKPSETKPVTTTPSPKIPLPKPIPALDRWVCDSQLRDCQDDNQAIRDYIDKYLAEVIGILNKPASEIKEKQRALGIALTAAIWASDKLEDSALATNICDEYMMPNLGSVKQSRGDYLSQEAVMLTAISVWQKAGKVDNVITAYKQLIESDPSLNTADANRIRLAEFLTSEKRYEEAISFLQQIDDNGDCTGAKTIIEELQKKLEEQKNNNGENSSEVKR